MSLLATETVHDQANGLDAVSDSEALGRLLDGQIAALQSVRHAIPAIAQAAALIETVLRGDGRLVYAGAGSSALMSCADGMELAGTFGLDPERIMLCMAGGLPQDSSMPGGTEDDTSLADADATSVTSTDAVIAVSASGRTPYTLRFTDIARKSGAKVIAIANNADSPIFTNADVSICLPTPAELVAGSTRMGAGTAQKAALNMLSTMSAIRLGHVYDGMMVNLRVDNEKLRARAASMVVRITGASEADARGALAANKWSVKIAVLTLSGAASIAEANRILSEARGHLRVALDMLNCAEKNVRQTSN